MTLHRDVAQSLSVWYAVQSLRWLDRARECDAAVQQKA